MKNWKWVALIACGGVTMQLNSCLVDLAFYGVQLLATELLPALLQGALSGSGTAA